MKRILCRIRPILAALSLAACFCAVEPAGAVITFTSTNTVMFSSYVVHAVAPTPGGWRMYVSSDSFRILSATSTDLMHDWTWNSGVRLSTSSSAGVDSSSVTCPGIVYSTDTSVGMRMFYVGVSDQGLYSVLSATSTDGLTWYREPGTRLRVNGGGAYIGSLAPIETDTSGGVRLFYIADNTNGNTGDPANWRIYSAVSSDGGVTLVEEGETLSGEQAYQVSVTTLTDGRTRLYYAAPLTGETTASQVLSAVSANGLSFTKESGVRLSTTSSSAALTHPVVVRSTETFRWRMFYALQPIGSTVPYIDHAMTLHPTVSSIDPSSYLKNQSNIAFTVTGEVLSPNDQVTFYQGASTITATGVAATDDLTLTGTVNPFNQSTGLWNLVVTDPNDRTGTLLNAIDIDIPPGEVSILDNLFRPLQGGSASISVTIFEAGRVTMRLYTSDGGLVATLLDRTLPFGQTSVTWDGRTASGNTVASGVYLLSTRGPKLTRIDKIVVIK